jgi:hypothetical protein
MIFLVPNICHFPKNKSLEQHGQGSFLEIFQKILSHFEQESYENAKIFGGFEQISSFFLIFFLQAHIVSLDFTLRNSQSCLSS